MTDISTRLAFPHGKGTCQFNSRLIQKKNCYTPDILCYRDSVGGDVYESPVGDSDSTSCYACSNASYYGASCNTWNRNAFHNVWDRRVFCSAFDVRSRGVGRLCDERSLCLHSSDDDLHGGLSPSLLLFPGRSSRPE